MSNKPEIQLNVRCVRVAEIIPLRHEVLKPGMPVDVATWDGDEKPTTWHIAAFSLDDGHAERSTPICCGSFEPNPFDCEPAYQLRGMATKAAFQGRGIGRRFLHWSEAMLSERAGTRLFWCNSRVSATGFYEKLGWSLIPGVFEVLHAGPCQRMIHRV